MRKRGSCRGRWECIMVLLTGLGISLPALLHRPGEPGLISRLRCWHDAQSPACREAARLRENRALDAVEAELNDLKATGERGGPAKTPMPGKPACPAIPCQP